MKEKIASQLKAKYPGVNLSKARIDAIADKLSQKITDENEIDAKLDELNEIHPFSEIAKYDDYLRTRDSKKPAQQKQDPPSEPAETKSDDTPEWAKNLINEVQTLKKEKTLSTIQEKVKAHEKLKAIPASYYKGRQLPEKEEDLDAFVAEIESDYTAFKQELINEGLATSSKPATGGIKTDSVDADIQAWASKGKPQTQTK